MQVTIMHGSGGSRIIKRGFLKVDIAEHEASEDISPVYEILEALRLNFRLLLVSNYNKSMQCFKYYR